MAEVVASFPNPRSRSKCVKWFDGQIWALSPGVDFTSAISSMQSYLPVVARRHGYTLKTATKDGVLYVQAVKKAV